jgi:hypothetical protein
MDSAVAGQPAVSQAPVRTMYAAGGPQTPEVLGEAWME